MKRLAIIPARSGSKGLPEKNIRLLSGKPLMAYSIEAAEDSGLFDRIYVSTDSEEYKKIAEDYGASVPFLRPENLAGDTASSWDVVKQALAAFEEMGEVYDEIALLQPTSPLRSADDIRKAHSLMEEKEARSIIGVCPMDHSPLWSNTLPKDGSMAGFLRPETVHMARQALPEYYRINGAIYWIKKECLDKIEDLYEKQCFAYVMPVERSVDIDTLTDFYQAEALLQTKKKRNLQEELDKIKEIKFHNPNEALERYSALLEEETEEKGIVCYHFGCFLHAAAEEEMAMELFVQAYKKGVFQEEILAICLGDFWAPNKEIFREAYQSQTKVLQERPGYIEIPDFENLRYFMFPVSDSKVMVYDRWAEAFLGWLETGAGLTGKNLKEPTAFFPVIMDMENNSLQDLISYFYQNQDRKIYVLDTEYEWMSLLMIPDILSKMSSVVPLQGIEAAKEFFMEHMCRLPEIVRVEEEETAQEIGKILREEHERRIREQEKEKIQPLLTIGIPSWNRGKRAKGLVEKLCKLPYDVDMEILVSNNGSDKEVEEYHAIRDMQDTRITYIEFEENKMYYGNIAQVCRKASGNWVLLLSDEDELVSDQLQDYMARLEQFKEKVAVIRPGTTFQYCNMEPEYQKAGENALMAYSLNNTYVSGATYNRKFMTRELVDKIEEKWIENYAYQIYAHMIFDWYMCLKGDFYRYEPILVQEGEAEGSSENKNKVYEYNKFHNRLKQFSGYLDIINGMEEASDREKVILFITAGSKTIILLCMLKENYIKECGSWEVCQNETLALINAGYRELNIAPENLKYYKSDISGNIQSVIEQCGF